MADNISVTPGTGKTVATDEVVDGTLGTVQVQVVKMMDGTLGSTNKLIVSAAGAAKVDGSAVTQPISGTVTATQATGTNLHTVVDSGTITTVSAVTTITDALPAGTNVIGHVIVDSGTVAATQSGTWTVQPGNTPNTTPWLVGQIPSALSVTATGAAAAAVTATLPAVSSQFHYITGFEIEAYSTAARTGGTTPILVTTTNLPGSNVFTFASAAAIGSTDTKEYFLNNPIKSSVSNTATTVVCPATTAIIWRVNVYYYSAA